jgi:diguanylate cyclase (GGDEF)-like protein/PAS domain S-box-containing protein
MGHEDGSTTDGTAGEARHLPTDDTDVLGRLLDVLPYLTFLLDSVGQILWTNAAVERIFGYRPAEVIGTNIFDYVDAEWDPGALGSIAEALDADGLRLPAVFQVVRKDGSTLIVEAWANSQLNDPLLQGLVACVRRWDERILLDRAFESLASGEALEDTLRLLVQVMAAETLDAHGAVVYDADGRPGFEQGVAHDALHPSQHQPGSGGDDSPWEQARRRGEPTVVATADLPESMRSAAEAQGHQACWVWPVTDGQGGVEACLVVWRRGEEVIPDFTRVRLLESLVRLARLAFERDRHQSRLEHAATHDPLTHLANRTAFYDALDQATNGPPERLLGVLYLDLDGFKPVNDELGHGAGDEVLVAVARRLLGTVRDADVVARLGGDEFAVLCPQLSSTDELGTLAERLVHVVAEPFEVRGKQVALGVSVGASTSPAGEADVDHLVEAADRALYQVKRTGKGGWQIASSESAVPTS